MGSNPYAVAAGPAGLWVANSGDNTIQRIDTSSGVPGHPVDVGVGPDGLAVDDASVWVANGGDGTVMHIDSRTGDPMSPPIPVGSGPSGMARVGDDLWVANELSQNVSRIDVATRHTVSIDVGDGPTSIAVLGGAIWVAEKYSGELLRIDPGSGERSPIRVGAPAHGLAEVDGHMWVASGAFPSTGHRGGTLRVAAATLPGKYAGIDPARVYDRTTYHAERIVYDGLLAYHYSNADPQVLVPDLAAQVPAPLDGGRTYVFNLRRGIRYSTGVEVLASDFVRGVYRALRPTAAQPDFYAGIVGGEACIHHPSSCDLSKGVVADDDAGRVTFHLTAPDPQFLPKLTILVVPAPPGTPLGRITSPLPGTGPYRISAYRRGSEFALSRNATSANGRPRRSRTASSMPSPGPMWQTPARGRRPYGMTRRTSRSSLPSSRTLSSPGRWWTRSGSPCRASSTDASRRRLRSGCSTPPPHRSTTSWLARPSTTPSTVEKPSG